MVTLVLLFAAVAAQAQPVIGIHDIQGAAHLSPYDRQTVTTEGIVTAVTPRGFYAQSQTSDGDPATSEGIYVETIRRPTVLVGSLVRMTGRVGEDYPGGPSSGNLSITTLKRPDLTVLREGVRLPEPTVIGRGGRLAPGAIISNDADGPAEESFFDPAEDALDFYESLEGMLVQVNDPISVGTIHTRFGEIWVVPDGGRDARERTSRGGIVVREGDFNPERILIDYLEDELIHFQREVPLPVVGDRFLEPILGIVSYSWSNYKLLLLGELPPLEPANLQREAARTSAEVARFAGVNEEQILSVAAFNVQNLSGESEAAKFRDIAETIVDGLDAPDLVLLSEIQDSDGRGRSGDTSSARTAARLLAAIEVELGAHRASGAAYAYADIAPQNNRDGGQPNANIRPGFLYRTDRVDLVPGSLELIQPEARAFVNSRKPLAGLFRFRGETVLAVSIHFSSKSGDGGLFGRIQPPNASSEVARGLQAQAVNEYAAAALDREPGALLVVGGDLNDFAFSRSLQILRGDQLVNLADDLPDGEVYSYIYEGNSQALDHILVSEGLARKLAEPVDYVHRYAEFLFEERWSDHDPVIARFVFD